MRLNIYAMSDKRFRWDFRGRRSIRLKEYDYSWAGCYFVTICTDGRKSLFGRINEGRMELNRLGHIVRREWKLTLTMRKQIHGDAFIIMPNHVHLIFWITRPNHSPMTEETHDWRRGDARVAPPSSLATMPIRTNGPTSRSVSSIIGAFKSSVSKSIHRMDKSISQVWQRNYWDHIVMSDPAHWAIREYIQNNPKNWIRDSEYRND